MKIMKKAPSDGVPYARKAEYEYEGKKYEADLKDKDIVTILDGGSVVVDKWGKDSHEFKIETRNGTKKVALNQSSLNVLVDSFGDESSEWIDKKVNVILQKAVINNERRIKAFFVTEGWQLDDYGALENPNNNPETGGDQTPDEAFDSIDEVQIEE